MHLPTLKWTSSFLYETIARKKDVRKALLLRKNVKYKDVKRKPVLANLLPFYAFIFELAFVLIN